MNVDRILSIILSSYIIYWFMRLAEQPMKQGFGMFCILARWGSVLIVFQAQRARYKYKTRNGNKGARLVKQGGVFTYWDFCFSTHTMTMKDSNISMVRIYGSNNSPTKVP